MQWTRAAHATRRSLCRTWHLIARSCLLVSSLHRADSHRSYINYSMARIRMLRHHGVEPYIVFDGDRLPAKSRTEEGREA